MDIPGEKLALQEIQELEKRFEENLAGAKAGAEKKVAAAKTRAEKLIGEKEKKLDKMRRLGAKSFPAPLENETAKINPDKHIDRKVVETLAKDLFERITRT